MPLARIVNKNASETPAFLVVFAQRPQVDRLAALGIKSYVNASNLAGELKKSSLSEGSVISCGDYEVLRQLHIRGVRIPLVLILAISNRRSIKQNFMNALLCVLPRLLPEFLQGVAVYHRLARKTLIYNLQRKGIKVFVWTVDEPKDMKKFILLGVNGIITNYPDRLYTLTYKSKCLR